MLGLVGIGPSGCADVGEVSIRVLLPDDLALSPADARLAELTLVTVSDEDGRLVETRAVLDRGAPLEMGQLAAGSEVRFALELRSPTQRLIGYGQTAGPIEIAAGEAIDVPIFVRRPFVYLSGAAGELAVYDPTLDLNADYASAIEIAAPRAAAPTADGTAVVVAHDAAGAGSLGLVSTADHLASADEVALARPPRDVAVTADGRFAVVAHPGDAGGVSVVDLVDLAGGEAAATFLPVGSTGAVVVTGGGADDPARAYALVRRAAECEGASASTLIEITLGDTPAVARTLELGAPIADLAVTDGGSVLVAEPCAGRVALIDLDDGGRSGVLDVPSVGAVAVLGSRLWAAGVAPASATLGLRIALVSRELGGGAEARLELPPAQERIESIEFSGSDQAVEVAIEADTLAAVELAALPGSDLVALTTRAYYHADEAGDFLGNPVVPEMEITTHEYLLVDASTRTVAQRVRTYCDGFLLSEAVLSEFECSTAPDQDTIPFADRFEPSQIAVLYGGR